MKSLNAEVITWFSENRRDLPWRSTDAWGVLVSEFMLQQTPVARVLPVWNAWMLRWPTPHALAAATPAEVITAWGRLGYPRRALRLYQSAKIIVADFAGSVPRSPRDLLALPGVGEYTAAAITAFAYEERSLVLDTNIRRLLARIIDGVEFPTPTATKSEKRSREALIPSEKAHVWAAATMELGALICTAKNPRCQICPVKTQCKWSALGYPKSERISKRQSWHGTDRQCRGKIVQALRESISLTEGEIKKLWQEDSQVEKALQTLEVDGLIQIKTQSNSPAYSLPW